MNGTATPTSRLSVIPACPNTTSVSVARFNFRDGVRHRRQRRESPHVLRRPKVSVLEILSPERAVVGVQPVEAGADLGPSGREAPFGERRTEALCRSRPDPRQRIEGESEAAGRRPERRRRHLEARQARKRRQPLLAPERRSDVAQRRRADPVRSRSVRRQPSPSSARRPPESRWSPATSAGSACAGSGLPRQYLQSAWLEWSLERILD